MTNSNTNLDDSGLATKKNSEKDFSIVGIGASAGGLEAFTQLLSGLKADSGMAYVLIQHLEPTHESHLAEILSKSSPLPVHEVSEGMVVEPNQIYVIPPNVNMAISKGVLSLTPRGESRGAHLPINFFLRSLAQDKQRHAIGVILSGTGSDGTLGLGEIKAAGGITFAQDESSARFPGKPKSAFSDGFVDIVLPPGDIGHELARIREHPYLSRSPNSQDQSFNSTTEDYNRIIALLRGTSGVDFSHYRDTTLKRRILRRMALGRHEKYRDYVRYLESNEAEVKELYQDILIHVTRFFRDPEVYEAIAKTVLPAIQKTKSAEDSLRVWVAGCSTGEEAYSLAMLFTEFQEKQESRCEIRIFASDISESSLEKARMGAYPLSIEQDVSEERLRRFFVKNEDGYRVTKEIREMCLFAKHDVGADPPFAKLDLISCRNLLIYLSGPLQARIIPAFHYALNSGGFLLLGTSESIGREADLFTTIDSQHKIFSKKMSAVRIPNLLYKGKETRSKGKEKAKSVQSPPSQLDFQQATDRMLLRKFIPPGVLVNKDMDVLQFRGRTSPFLEPPQEGTSLNLARMAQESLSLELRNAIRECEASDAPVRREDLKILDGRTIRQVNVEIQPVSLPGGSETCFLILFEEKVSAGSRPSTPIPNIQRGPEEDEEVSILRLELSAAREYLQTIREQCEAVNEELKSSNEEMESTNEEMQSTNEELETAKEELQSGNEELATMNEELRTRNIELGQLNDDLGNLLSSVEIPIIMLGSDLCIRRFTPAAGKSLRLNGTDIGRPIGNVRIPIPEIDFESHVQTVIASQQPEALECRDQDGKWHALNFHPYRTFDGRIEGALVVVFDIDKVKSAQQQLQESGDFARAIVNTVREPLLLLEEDLRIHSANLSYYHLFATEPKHTEGRFLHEVAEGRWQIPELLALLQNAPDTGSVFENFEVNQTLPDGKGEICLVLNARRLLQDHGRKRITLLAIEDITDRKRAQRGLRLLKFFSDQSSDPYFLMNRTAKFSYVNRSACERLGYSESELLSMSLHDVDPDCTGDHFAEVFERAQAATSPPFETEHISKSGRRYPVECSVTGVTFEGEAFMLVVARDITEWKLAAEALHQSEEKLRQSQRMEAIGKLAGGVAHDFNNLLTAINGYSDLCLSQVPETGSLHDHLVEIHKAGERAADLTRQLLAYSRKQVLMPKVMNLNTIVANMHQMLTRLIGSGHRLSLSLDETLGMVKADPGQMEQILINLVMNARDALPDGGEITLRTWNEEISGKPASDAAIPPGAYAVFSVEDNGIGMDAELQQRIFEPFFTTKEVGKGTGLGLSVVQGIISQSGAYMAMESIPGHGSTFKIYLPTENGKSAAPHEDAATDLELKGTETVLLVEDADTVRKFTRSILEMQGYAVLEANNGQSALFVNEQFKDSEIHILVTDMVMPGMGGYELAERFLESRPNSRVLFMSGYTEEAIFDKLGKRTGDTHFIQKPFSPAQFARAVRNALEPTLLPPG